MDNSWRCYSTFIAERAAEIMREKKITQLALAAKLRRTQQYVSHILSGRANLTIETVALLSDALDSNLMKGLLLGFPEASDKCGLLMDDLNEIPYGSLRSSLPVLVSSAPITRRFNSGERPFLITCEDSKKYLCKAALFGSSAVNLARELIGSSFANIWGLADMKFAIVKILPGHLDGDEFHFNYAVSCLGREWVEESVEIKDDYLAHMDFSKDTTSKLLKLALFDIWLSNEDRLNNNLNLLYSNGRIIAMDHAGIFNGSFAVPLLQLSLTDSLIYSNLFSESVKDSLPDSDRLGEVEVYFADMLLKCKESIPEIWCGIPNDWNIDKSKFDRLMEYIFSRKWTDACISNFKNLVAISTE